MAAYETKAVPPKSDKEESGDIEDGSASGDESSSVMEIVQRSQQKIPTLPPTEREPWKSISYIVFTIQFFFVTLDLFVETADNAAWHHAINSITFLVALYLALYQLVRFSYVLRKGIVSSPCSRPMFWFFLALSMQLFIAAVTGFWFNVDNDRDTNYLEWALFGVSLVWGFVNPITFSAVKKAASSSSNDVAGSGAKGKASPGRIIISVFSKHFTRAPLLFVAATIFASGNAILMTYQGAVINELTRLVTRLNASDKGPEIEGEISSLAGTLTGVWFAASVCRFLFDFTSASMFSKLECWLKRTIFQKAFESSSSSPISEENYAGEYLARYTSDVNGVMALYSTLLRGVIMNVLLIITSFVFLVLQEWRIAAITLGFLAMGVTSGPTDLAGSATADAQVIATKGMTYFGDELRDGPTADVSVLTKKHEEECLALLKRSLWKQNFYSNSVDAYINFFASFLTVVVVITLVWEVYFDDLDSSQFLGIFFIYRQLQKPSMKISSVIKSAVRRSANVKRINEVIFS